MKKYKRLVSLALAAVMAFSLAACGKSGDTETNQGNNGSNGNNGNGAVEVREYTYVPEYISMDDESANLYNVQFVGDSVYYLSGSFDEETQKYIRTLCEYSVAEKKTVRTIEFKTEEEEGNSRNISRVRVLEDESFVTVENVYREDGSKAFFCTYDKDGNKQSEQEITDMIKDEDGYGGYVDVLLVDNEGRIYLKTNENVQLLDKDGSYHGKVVLENGWINQMCMDKDGKVYITYYDYNSESDTYCLAEIDFAGSKFGTVYKNFPNGNSVAAGKETDFIVRTGSAVYAYDLETQASEQLFAWLDSDINGDYVDSIGVMEDGRIIVSISDWETREESLALLTKTKTEELPQKTQIVIATLNTNQELRAAAVAFNRQSDTYHVTIKNYIDENAGWTENLYSDARNRMSSDIVSKTNSPDLILLDDLPNAEQLAANGIFEDLVPYLEKSSALKKEDYLPNLLASYTYDGKLAGIPKQFSASTIVGKTSDVGSKQGWTLDEMMAYAQEHQDKQIFEYMNREFMLEILLSCNGETFIDYGTGKASFDSEEFEKVLTFVGSFPEEMDYDSDDTRSTPIKLQEGDVLLEQVSIYEFDSLQLYEAMFGEPVTFVGYPTMNGGSGCILSAQGALGISANAQNKDGAWAFIESYQMRESDMFSFGLPAMSSKIKKMREEATKAEYVLDENGEPMLDEDGNKIEQGTHGVGYGDWEYYYHTPTDEEADKVMELIESAESMSMMDDQILAIIAEEAAPFFQGQKSVHEVTGIIQSRVQLYLDENQ